MQPGGCCRKWLTLWRKYLHLPFLSCQPPRVTKNIDFMIIRLTVRNLDKFLNVPATSATGGVLGRSAGTSLHSPPDYPQRRKKPASRGPTNLMDEDF